MRESARTLSLVSVAVAALLPLTAAQAAPTTEFWPELDLWSPTYGQFQGLLRIAGVRDPDTGERVDATIKGLVDYRLNTHLSLRTGYSYASTPSTPTSPHSVDRYAIVQLTYQWKLDDHLRLANRARLDIGDAEGEDYRRYRDRLQLDYGLEIRRHEVTPYGNIEAYYDSRYGTVNRYRLELGATSRISKVLTLDLYLARQRDEQPSRKTVNALGLTINTYL